MHTETKDIRLPIWNNVISRGCENSERILELLGEGELNIYILCAKVAKK